MLIEQLIKLSFRLRIRPEGDIYEGRFPSRRLVFQRGVADLIGVNFGH